MEIKNVHTSTLPLQFWIRILQIYLQVNVSLERWIVHIIFDKVYCTYICKTPGKSIWSLYVSN